MKISASLYSNRERTLTDLATELDECHIDLFHIDCNDDLSVFDDIKEIRKVSNTPIDLHIISDTPEKYFSGIADLKVEYVTFQYENLPSTFSFPQSEDTSFGLAVTTNTDISVFNHYKEVCDFILIMTTVPGQSGGKFKKENFQKIRKFRKAFPGKKIHVDGGVNDETGFILRLLGVHSVVSGSYLVKNKSVPLSLLHLRSSIVHSDYQLKDFYIDLAHTPHLDIETSGFPEALNTIDQYDLGFVCYTKGDNEFAGLCSNADIRKGLLKNMGSLDSIDMTQVINPNPVTINEDASISEMLHLIQSKEFVISFLPVVDKQNKLKGAVTFFNLIRSES